jgi:hypothetical protein
MERGQDVSQNQSSNKRGATFSILPEVPKGHQLGLVPAAQEIICDTQLSELLLDMRELTWKVDIRKRMK